MNLIERLASGLMGILFIAFATVLLLSPLAVEDFVSRVAALNIILRLLMVVVLYAAVMGLVYLRVRRGSSPQIKGLLVKASGSVTSLSTESAEGQILDAVRAVPAVKTANIRVKSVRGRADILMDVVVGREVQKLPKKQRELSRAVDQVVKRQLGLRYASRPVIQLRIDDDETGQVSVTSAAENVQPVETPTVQLPKEQAAKAEGKGDKPDEQAGRRLGGLFGGKRDPGNADDETPTVVGQDDDSDQDDFYAFLSSTANNNEPGSASSGNRDRDAQSSQGDEATQADDSKFSW